MLSKFDEMQSGACTEQEFGQMNADNKWKVGKGELKYVLKGAQGDAFSEMTKVGDNY